MENLLVSPYLLALLFLVVAFAYSSVGLGGGTSFTALLAIFGAGHQAIPTVSLTLNVIVTLIGSGIFLHQRYGRIRLIAPFLVASLPFAYLGGSLDLSPGLFYGLLLVTLVLVAGRIFLWKDARIGFDLSRNRKLALALLLGTLIGFIAGAVGIGGGIYLVPLVIVLGLGTEREAAACGAVFTGMNSASGLIARVQHHPIELTAILPLVAAVVVGGVAGAWMGARRLSPRALQRVLGGIVVVAILLLARRMVTG